MTGKKKIADVIKYLDFQKTITGNVTGDDHAGFHISSVPGANDEPDFHVARSILKKLEREGYIKFTDTTSIKELNGFCVVEFLPKYKWIKLKNLLAIDWWKITNPFWLITKSLQNLIRILLWTLNLILHFLVHTLIQIFKSGNT